MGAHGGLVNGGGYGLMHACPTACLLHECGSSSLRYGKHRSCWSSAWLHSFKTMAEETIIGLRTMVLGSRSSLINSLMCHQEGPSARPPRTEGKILHPREAWEERGQISSSNMTERLTFTFEFFPGPRSGIALQNKGRAPTHLCYYLLSSS